jgi:hypothetical protein
MTQAATIATIRQIPHARAITFTVWHRPPAPRFAFDADSICMIEHKAGFIDTLSMPHRCGITFHKHAQNPAPIQPA